MSSDGVSQVGAGAGERVGEMVNGTNLASGTIAGLGTCGSGRYVGAGTRVFNELAEVGEFSEGDRGGFGKEVHG